MITETEYKKALTICQLYKQQVITEVEQFKETSIRSFIEYNKHRMSKRLINVLNNAIESGYKTIEELTDSKLMSLRSCGILTVQEFNNLTRC